MNYLYKEIVEGERQYDDINLEDEKVVDAVYVKSMLPIDNGNPFIEALPFPLHDKEVIRVYSKNLIDYNASAVSQMNNIEKLLSISTLRQVRFYLPFHDMLEYEFYNALINSYRVRKIMTNDVVGAPAVMENQNTTVNSKLVGNSGDAANVGFSLIGYSGCGKSSALSILLSHYPQVIRHHSDDIPQLIQIVYLVVNCVPNSNFQALYAGIGKAIDKALGNINPFYESEITRQRSLGGKLNKIIELVELFSIGIIVFDEIQLIDFDSAHENSFDSLLTLNNITKVAISVLGTEDAFGKMFPNLRTARRLGSLISGNMYCDNYEFFTFIVKSLMKYQWFDKPIILNKEIIDTLFKYTKGIIDQLIGLYCYMHVDYLKMKNKPVINEEFIRKVSMKHFPDIQNVLAHMKDPDAERKREEMARKAEMEMLYTINEVRQNEAVNKATQTMQSSEYMDTDIIKKKVVENIQMVTNNYNAITIINCVDKVLNVKGNETLSEKDLSTKVLERLLQGKTDKRRNERKINKTDIIQMRSYLNEETRKSTE